MQINFTFHTELLLPLIIGMWALGMALFGYFMFFVRRRRPAAQVVKRWKGRLL
jgi:hypothetical protein